MTYDYDELFVGFKIDGTIRDRRPAYDFMSGKRIQKKHTHPFFLVINIHPREKQRSQKQSQTMQIIKAAHKTPIRGLSPRNGSFAPFLRSMAMRKFMLLGLSVGRHVLERLESR